MKAVQKRMAHTVGSEQRHYECVTLLIQKGANVNITDNDGETALDIAIKAKYNKMFNRGDDPRSYNIELFYKLISTIVKLDIRNNGEKVQRISKHMDIKKLDVKVLSECPIDGVNLVFSTSLYKVIALNCSAKPVHSAKTPNEVGRPAFDTKTAPEEMPDVAKIGTIEVVDDRYQIENEEFLDEVSEL